MKSPLIVLASLVLMSCSPTSNAPPEFIWIEQDSTVDLSLRGLAVVDSNTVWIGGPEGTVLKTINGGETWTRNSIPGAENLDLRSVHGFDENHALFFTAGSPARLYVTHDGGQNFETVYEDPSETAFFDSLEFWDDQNGIAFSDPVDGQFHILLTSDGGHTWSSAENLPLPLEGEAGFAASDTSIAVAPGGTAWIGTGGAETARMLHTEDWGQTWQAHETPLAAGTGGSGIFSVTYSLDRLISIGGNYTDPDRMDDVAAWSDDRGEIWHTPDIGPSGYRSAVTNIPGHSGYLITVGPNGTDLSTDNAETWERISETGFHAIAFSPDGQAGWAIGSEGRISKITFTSNR